VNVTDILFLLGKSISVKEKGIAINVILNIKRCERKMNKLFWLMEFLIFFWMFLQIFVLHLTNLFYFIGMIVIILFYIVLGLKLKNRKKNK
jgi:hypothetical protein